MTTLRHINACKNTSFLTDILNLTLILAIVYIE